MSETLPDNLKVVPTPGGGHDVVSTLYKDPEVLLIRVDPVGTLEWGDLKEFSDSWVPTLVKALMLAQRIANRDNPDWDGSMYVD